MLTVVSGDIEAWADLWDRKLIVDQAALKGLSSAINKAEELRGKNVSGERDFFLDLLPALARFRASARGESEVTGDAK